MRDTDRVLGEVLDEARTLLPPTPPFDGVRRRARRRAMARRTASVAAVLLFGAGAVAAAGVGDGDPTKVAVTDAPAVVEQPASTTTTVVRAADPPPSTTTPEPSPSAENPPPSESNSTTTTGVAPKHPADEAPAAYVTGDGGEVRMQQGSSCWRPTTPDRAALCSDASAEFADEAPQVSVVSGGTLSVRWAVDQQPTGVRVIAHEWEGRRPHELDATQGNPAQVLAKLEPGEYVLFVFSTWKQGDVLHGVRLVVTAPAA